MTPIVTIRGFVNLRNFFRGDLQNKLLAREKRNEGDHSEGWKRFAATFQFLRRDITSH